MESNAAQTAGESAQMSASKAAFVAESGGAYGYGGHATLQIDAMRANEFPHMRNSVYLDHAGATMYSKTQLDAAFQELQNGLFTNPHSATGNAHAESTTAKIDNVCRQVLGFFSASEEEYTLIFTSGATAALKLVGESFPWTKNSTFAHSMDSHTSVLGIRGNAAAHGATIKCVELSELEQLERQNEIPSAEAIYSPSAEPFDTSVSLFAYPAECNFSGVRHSLGLVNQIRSGRWENGSKDTNWLVLVDAAKYVATHKLDLSVHRPDFVVLSFYKIFGYPSGLGALIAKKTALSLLKREYQGGGTVSAILAGRNYAVPRGINDNSDASSRFADGTQSFLSILALRHGIRQIEKLGMTNISAHTAALRALLVDKLVALKHWNGRPICELYGANGAKPKAEQQGPIVTCNFLRADTSYVGYSEVHKLAEIHNIHLRTGCFCNPGACQHYLGLKEADLMSNIAAGHVCGDDIDVVNGLPTGAVRLSLGYMTTYEDIEAFVEFVSKYFVARTMPAKVADVIAISPRSACSKGPHICKLTLFPMKSCAGMIVDAWPVGSRGLLFDREFAIVDLSTGNALTLKTLPDLCFLHPVIDLGRETLTISYRKPGDLHQSTATSSSPELQHHPSSFTIALRADISTRKHRDNGNPRRMRVCTDTCTGRDVSGDVSQWLSSCLNRQCALVRVSSNHLRASQANHSKSIQRPEAFSSTASIGFANQAQYLLVSRQSIAHFNEVLNSVDSSMNISEDAFRANFIVDGCSESFEEDKWKRLRIGDVTFDVSGPCSRCNVINLDPHTGAFHRQPLQVLSSYRRQRSSIFFGQFLTGSNIQESVPWLRIGDQVEVEE
ncbi:Molybdenum cofactor sulfurase [Phytophthora citrophthora]|uniref:Molybdenum cofactor sulfurase n=1 Tax=Phytophthora citrophthora TaxID=4793 RepID=A0AAD9G9Q2_9STRA|nr:Molybdenum cofactor sulfurase [Phytophthora citrophthora]